MELVDKLVAILISAPLIVLLVLYIRFSPVVFGTGKKELSDVSFTKLTLFYLMFSLQLSIPFYALSLYAMFSDMALRVDGKAVVISLFETVLTAVGVLVLTKYAPAFRFPVHFLIHVIRRARMPISAEVSNYQLLHALILTYVGLVLYIALMVSLVNELSTLVGLKYPNNITTLFLIGVLSIAVIRFVLTTERGVNKVVLNIIKSISS